MKYTLGLDYGTNLVRSLTVDCSNGNELATYVFPCPSGHQDILTDKQSCDLFGGVQQTDMS